MADDDLNVCVFRQRAAERKFLWGRAGVHEADRTSAQHHVRRIEGVCGRAAINLVGQSRIGCPNSQP